MEGIRENLTYQAEIAEVEALPFLDDCGSLNDLKLNN